VLCGEAHAAGRIEDDLFSQGSVKVGTGREGGRGREGGGGGKGKSKV
jgi:hypothetical protein